jgi:predicted cobalt transporter CbtA
VSAPLQLTAEAFEAAEEGDSEGASAAPGQLLNVNTLQRFKDLDRAALLDQVRPGGACWVDVT